MYMYYILDTVQSQDPTSCTPQSTMSYMKRTLEHYITLAGKPRKVPTARLHVCKPYGT